MGIPNIRKSAAKQPRAPKQRTKRDRGSGRIAAKGEQLLRSKVPWGHMAILAAISGFVMVAYALSVGYRPTISATAGIWAVVRAMFFIASAVLLPHMVRKVRAMSSPSDVKLFGLPTMTSVVFILTVWLLIVPYVLNGFLVEMISSFAQLKELAWFYDAGLLFVFTAVVLWPELRAGKNAVLLQQPARTSSNDVEDIARGTFTPASSSAAFASPPPSRPYPVPPMTDIGVRPRNGGSSEAT